MSSAGLIYQRFCAVGGDHAHKCKPTRSYPLQLITLAGSNVPMSAAGARPDRWILTAAVPLLTISKRRWQWILVLCTFFNTTCYYVQSVEKPLMEAPGISTRKTGVTETPARGLSRYLLETLLKRNWWHSVYIHPLFTPSWYVSNMCFLKSTTLPLLFIPLSSPYKKFTMYFVFRFIDISLLCFQTKRNTNLCPLFNKTITKMLLKSLINYKCTPCFSFMMEY